MLWPGVRVYQDLGPGEVGRLTSGPADGVKEATAINEGGLKAKVPPLIERGLMMSLASEEKRDRLCAK